MTFFVIDIGTSGCRAAVVSEEGRIVSMSRTPISVDVSRPSFAEVDADYIWEQTLKVVRLEFEKNPELCPDAVGVGAMLGYVFLDVRGEPLAPAIIWMDNRAAAEVEEIHRNFSLEELYRKTGRRISPELLAPKLLWMAKHRPELFQKTDKIIGLKDEMVRRLTGTITTDFSHANYTFLYNVAQKRFDADILESLGLKDSLFPQPETATEIVGGVTQTASGRTGFKTGLPVIAGSSDGTTAMYGGGVLDKGTAVLVSGTTDVMMVGSPVYPRDPSHTLTINNAMTPDLFLVGGTMGLTGGTLKKMEALFNITADRIEDEIAGLAPGSNGLLFFPGLTGERAPYWKEYSTGAIVGLRIGHTAGHVFRSLMEGSAFRLSRLLKLLKDNHLAPQKIHLMGGCAQMEVWNRIRADVLGLPAAKPASTEATVLGTAMFCRAGLSHPHSPADIAREWVKIEKRYIPDPEAVSEYRKIGRLFEKFLDNNANLFHNLRTFG